MTVPAEVDRAVDLTVAATIKAQAVLAYAQSADPRVPGVVPAAREALTKAEAAERAAYDARAAADLDTPGVRRLVEVLKSVNKELNEATRDLKDTLADLQAFTRVAKGMAGVLKAFLGG